MTRLNQPLSDIDMWRELEARVRVLETSPRVPNISTSAGGVQSDRVGTLETLSSATGYTNLATVGPTLTDVKVGQLGVLIVVVSASIYTSAGTVDGFMSIEVSGPTSSSLFTPFDAGAIGSHSGIPAGYSIVRVFEGLTPGDYDVVAKYKMTGAGTASFSERSLTAIPL